LNHTLEPSSPAATYLETDPNNLAASLDADTAGYSKIQTKAADLISNAAHISSVYLSFTNWDAMIVALRTLLVFALLQRHFISGLTLRATKE
jgi:ABC-type maltose transport system permease subunit